MTARAFDDAAVSFDAALVQFDGCLLTNFDDPTAAFDEPLIDFNGCDNRTAAPATTGGSFRQYRTFRPDEPLRALDDEEALTLIFALL